jgi:CheY-like chemotaxis protein
MMDAIVCDSLSIIQYQSGNYGWWGTFMAKRVYVVDDDQAFCKMIVSVLRDDGYDAQSAYTGEAALTMYHAQPPDLILLDVAMPGISGFEVAAAIREDEQASGQHTKIVIMSALAGTFTVSVDFNAGIDSYLTKPLMPEEVLAHVEQLLAE